MLKIIFLPFRLTVLLILSLIAALLSMTFFYLVPRNIWYKFVITTTRLIIIIVGAKVKIIGQTEKTYVPSNSMVIANHMSWLDTLVMLSVYGISFVGKVEMSKWPIINHMIRASGVIFINRNNKRDILTANQKIITALKNQSCIGFFPEGKVNNGNELLPFKSSLFETAIQTKTKIIPIILTYKHKDGTFAQELLYAGRNLVQTIINTLLNSGNIIIEMNILPSVNSSDFSDRQSLAQDLHHQMEQVYLQKIKSH